jgi:hypothetical protein
MKKRITQKEAVLNYLIENGSITGSEAHTVTKRNCPCATLNCHKIIAKLKEDGIVFKPSQHLYNEVTKTNYKRHFIDLKKTPKKLLDKSK